jgi:KTSC domain
MRSSVIEDFDFDAESNALTIHFTTGRIYRYRLVPAKVFRAFAAAPSKGAFFNRQIRERYPFEELSAAGP